jgi:hypothetical protein
LFVVCSAVFVDLGAAAAAAVGAVGWLTWNHASGGWLHLGSGWVGS